MVAIARGMAMRRMLTVLVRLTKPGNRELVNQTTPTMRSTCSATGIQSRTLITLRHLFLSLALRMTLRIACRAFSTGPSA